MLAGLALTVPVSVPVAFLPLILPLIRRVVFLLEPAPVNVPFSEWMHARQPLTSGRKGEAM